MADFELKFTGQEVEDRLSQITDLVHDYEYPPSTVVSRVIRVVSQLDARVIRFQLLSDIVFGTVISISLDGGLSFKPLRDTSGVDITKLKKGFYEVIADATFFTLRSSGVDEVDGFAIIMSTGGSESGTNIGSTLSQIFAYNNGAYVTHSGTGGTVRFYNSNFTSTYNTVSSNVISNSATINQDGVWFGSTLAQNLRRVAHSNFANALITLPTNPEIMWADKNSSDFIYIKRNGVTTIEKYSAVVPFNTTPLATSASATGYGNEMRMVTLGDFLYTTEATAQGQLLRKLNATTMVVSAQLTLASGVKKLHSDGDFIYVSNNTARTIQKINPTTMAVAATYTIPSGGSSPYDYTVLVQNLYLHENKLFINMLRATLFIDKTTMTYIGTSPQMSNYLGQHDCNENGEAFIGYNNSIQAYVAKALTKIKI